MGKKLRREIGYWLDADLPTCASLTLPGQTICVRMATSTQPESECGRCEGQVRTPSLMSGWLGKVWELKRLLAMGVSVPLSEMEPLERKGLLLIEEMMERKRSADRKRRQQGETAPNPRRGNY